MVSQSTAEVMDTVMFFRLGQERRSPPVDRIYESAGVTSNNHSMKYSLCYEMFTPSMKYSPTPTQITYVLLVDLFDI